MATEQQPAPTDAGLPQSTVLKTTSSKHAAILLVATGVLVAGAGAVAWWILQR